MLDHAPFGAFPASGGPLWQISLPLYRALLGINMELTSAAMAIHEDRICVVSERSVSGLDPVEADELIKRVSYYASELDNKLASEFGGRLFNDA